MNGIVHVPPGETDEYMRAVTSGEMAPSWPGDILSAIFGLFPRSDVPQFSPVEAFQQSLSRPLTALGNLPPAPVPSQVPSVMPPVAPPPQTGPPGFMKKAAAEVERQTKARSPEDVQVGTFDFSGVMGAGPLPTWEPVSGKMKTWPRPPGFQPADPERAKGETWVRPDGSQYIYYPGTKTIEETGEKGSYSQAEELLKIRKGPFKPGVYARGLPIPSGPDAELRRILTNQPFEALQNFERNMGNKGIDSAQRPLYRGYLADMMTKIGIMEEEEAITYIEHGMGENVARMKLNIRAQEAATEMGEERIALAEARAAQGRAPSVPPMGLLKAEQDKATARLKKEGKWGALFMNPYGQAIPELYNRGGGTLGAYGKGTNLSEIDTVLNKIMAGEMLDKHETEVADNIVIVPSGGFAAIMKEQTLGDLGKQLKKERQGQGGARGPQGAPTTAAPTQTKPQEAWNADAQANYLKFTGGRRPDASEVRFRR